MRNLFYGEDRIGSKQAPSAQYSTHVSVSTHCRNTGGDIITTLSYVLYCVNPHVYSPVVLVTVVAFWRRRDRHTHSLVPSSSSGWLYRTTIRTVLYIHSTILYTVETKLNDFLCFFFIFPVLYRRSHTFLSKVEEGIGLPIYVQYRTGTRIAHAGLEIFHFRDSLAFITETAGTSEKCTVSVTIRCYLLQYQCFHNR